MTISVTVFFFFSFLLDKGHGAENLEKERLFLLLYYFLMKDSSEVFLRKQKRIKVLYT